jgi:hypothetical protein
MPPDKDDLDDDQDVTDSQDSRGTKRRDTLDAPGGTRGADGTSGDGDVTDDWPQEARELIRKLRIEARGSGKRAAEAERQLEEIRESQMTEADKIAKRAGDLEEKNKELDRRLRNQAIKDAFREAGREAGAKNPERLWRLIDRDAIEFDPNGEPINATSLIAELRQTDPYLFEPRRGKGGVDGGRQQGAPKFDMNSELRRAAGLGPR